jgi:hypothetical protein
MKPKENTDIKQIGLTAGRPSLGSDASAAKELTDTHCQSADTIQHDQGGNIRQAEESCKKIIAKQPDHTEALHLLGARPYRSFASAGHDRLSKGRHGHGCVFIPKNYRH